MVSVNFNFVYRPNDVPLGCFIYKIRYNVYATQKLQWRRFLTTPDMHIFILLDMDVPLSVALQSPIDNFVYSMFYTVHGFSGIAFENTYYILYKMDMYEK